LFHLAGDQECGHADELQLGLGDRLADSGEFAHEAVEQQCSQEEGVGDELQRALQAGQPVHEDLAHVLGDLALANEVAAVDWMEALLFVEVREYLRRIDPNVVWQVAELDIDVFPAVAVVSLRTRRLGVQVNLSRLNSFLGEVQGDS
jgi:hypothetical protein